MSTSTNPRPEVALPPGAVTDDDAWASWDNECRCFRGPDRAVLNGAAEVIAEVRTCGVQLADGSVDNGQDAPTIDVHFHHGSELSADQAQELARALLNAAAEVQRWVRG
ncbi:hypothetical protein [Mycobacterium sp. HUMS_1102779]|uniref:hypothetical protein n=1 Tax=Mycobacterium sp. HUMS_1102779 TaxID=3383487 RepID=UPI0038998684